MDFSLHFQKLCQVETRRLLLLMGMIASCVVVFQFMSLPYENILLTIFPIGKVSLLGTINDGNTSPESRIFDQSSTLNNSNSSYLSLPHGVASYAKAHDTGEDTKLANETTTKDGNLDASEKERAPHNALEQDSDTELDDEDTVEKLMDLNKDFRDENVTTQYNGSVSEKAVEPPVEQVKNLEHNFSLDSFHKEDTAFQLDKLRNRATDSVSPPVLAPVVSEEASPVEQVKNLHNFSSHDSQKEGTGLTLDKVGLIDNGPSFPPPGLPPVASSDDLTFHRELDRNLSTPISFVNSNMSLMGKQSPVLHPKDEKSELPRSSPTTSVQTFTPSNNPVRNGIWEMAPTAITSISEMTQLLHQHRASSNSMRTQWSSVRDQEILSAKSQIENAPILKKNLELYSPAFRNVSIFIRSYELMEQILKVYIYKEGAKPVFHHPELRGIYASEGWFMKHMEASKQFVVKDPRKAHMFYLPFSTRELEKALYVPDSHSSKNLVAYLKNYLDLIAAKYPFWNRTGGADHFLVGCHDWAPGETKHHMSKCIRALCNADVNEGFQIGKDVSLPETNVRVAKDPLRDLGGRPASQRQILAFFAGRMHGYLRPILLQYWENKDPDMQIYGRMGGKKSKANYIQRMKNSKYCICAKGYEVNSPRVVEAILYECVPVIISDNYVPPFFEVLDWEAFAVFVPEKDIPNLKNILLSIPQEKYLRMQMRVRKVQQHFLWHMKPVKYDLFHMILHSIWFNRVFES